MMRFWQRIRRTDRGASAVELALLTPFLATILVASVQIGTMFNEKQDLEAAARQAARHASDTVTVTRTDLTTLATAALDDSQGVVVTVTPDRDDPCSGRGGRPVEITVTSTEPLDLLFVSTVSIDIEGSAQFLCTTEQ